MYKTIMEINCYECYDMLKHLLEKRVSGHAESLSKGLAKSHVLATEMYYPVISALLFVHVIPFNLLTLISYIP